jgi:hypothetical protein
VPGDHTSPQDELDNAGGSAAGWGGNHAFPYALPMEAGQTFLSSIPLLVFYPCALACIGGAAFCGSVLGRSMPVEPESKDVTSYGFAALVGAGAAFASFKAKKKRDSAAVVDLYNQIAELEDPSQLDASTVSEVGQKYGINLRKDELEGLQKMYEQYLESLIPSGETQLRSVL